MDVTGLVALESALAKLHKDRFFVVLAGVQPQPSGVLRRAGIKPEAGRLALCETLEEAIELMQSPPNSPTPEEMSGQAA
jgi:SulP family sulfate permease